MSKEKIDLNSYTKIIAWFVGLAWLVSLWLVLYLIGANHTAQERYFQIEGVKIDFTGKSEYTIGGCSTRSDIFQKFSARNSTVADIWLPTQLIPANIGVLKYNKSEEQVVLELNDLILPEDVEDDKTLTIEQKMIFPSVVTEAAPKKRISGKTVYAKDLEGGIRIRYAEGKKEYMGLQLQRTDEAGVYKLLFAPRPDHLFTQLRQRDGMIRDTLEISYGSAPRTANESYHFDLYHFPYFFMEGGGLHNRSVSKLVAFEGEKMFIDGQLLTSGVLPESNILIGVKEEKGYSFFWWNTLAINVLFLVLYVAARLKTSTFKSYFRMYCLPLCILLIFYNVSMVLLSHYYFYFPFDQEILFHRYTLAGYILPFVMFLLGFYNWNEKGIWNCLLILIGILISFCIFSGNLFWMLAAVVLTVVALLFCLKQKDEERPGVYIIATFIICIVIGAFSSLNDHTDSQWVLTGLIWTIIAVSLLKWIFLILDTDHRWIRISIGIAVALGIGLCLLMASNQRIAFLPAHLIGRILMLFVYTVFALSLTTKTWVSFFIIPGLFTYGFFTGDMGFVMIAGCTLPFIFVFSQKKTNRWLILTVFAAVGCMWFFTQNTFQIFPSGDSTAKKGIIKEYQWGRFAVLKNNYENDSTYWISDRQTSDRHRIMLHEAIRNHPGGLWSEFNIPASFKNVIWSDYVFLYAMVYFGLYVMILLIVLLVIFLSSLTYIAYLSLNSSAIFAQEDDGKVSLFGTLIALILFGYVAQYLYMVGSILRVFPLTGQSMPFLSISWTEPLIFCFFLMGAYVCFCKQNSNIETTAKVDEVICKHTHVFLKIIVFFGVVVGVMVVWCCQREKDIPTGQRRYQRDLENAAVYNQILEAAQNKEKGEDWYKNLKQGDLIDICCQQLEAKPSDDEVKTKVDFIIQELSKLCRGRDSYLEFKQISDSSNTSQSGSISRICFRTVDINDQDLTYFAENLKRMPREYSAQFPLVETKMALYEKQNKGGKSEFRLVVPDYQDADYSSGVGLHITNKRDIGSDYKLLFDGNNRVFRRWVNNEQVLSYVNAGIYSGLPVFSNDFGHLQEYGLSIDEKLQAIVHAILTSRCQAYGIKAAGVVVLKNNTGAVRSLVSYPHINPNTLGYSKTQEIEDKFSNNRIKVDRGLCSVPLTAYHMASTWKFIEAATALQIDPKYYNKSYYSGRRRGMITMDTYIYQSDNDYSIALLKELLQTESKKFFHLLGAEYGMSRKRERYKDTIPFDYFRRIKYQHATLGDYDEQLTNHSPGSNFIKNTALGQQNMESSIVGSANNFARIISGKKVVPTLFNYKEMPEFVGLSKAEKMEPLKTSLNHTTLKGTAAKDLGKFNKSGSGSGKEKNLYAKTGTGDTEDTHSLIVFGTEEYTFGIFLYNRGKGKYSATRLAAEMIPSIQYLCPEYIKK